VSQRVGSMKVYKTVGNEILCDHARGRKTWEALGNFGGDLRLWETVAPGRNIGKRWEEGRPTKVRNPKGRLGKSWGGLE